MSVPVLRFMQDDGQDFPDWEFTQIGSVVKEKSPKFNPVKEASVLKCIELEHLSQGTGELLGYTDTSVSKSTKNKFKRGEVLFGKLRPYLKKYLLAPFDGACSTEIWVLKGDNLYNSFLFQFVQTDNFLTRANVSAGSKMPRADWNVVSASYSYFPTKPEQAKISNFLTAVDEKITQLTQKCELLAQYKKGVMRQIFSQELRFKDDDGQDFPEWSNGALGSAVVIQGGYAFKSGTFNSGTTRVIRIGDILPSIKLDEFTGVYSSEVPSDKYIVRKNDFMMALSGATFGKVGKIIDSGIAYINQRVATFRTEQNLEFFYQVVQSKDFRDYITSIPTASAQPNISNDDIGRYEMQIPCVEEQAKIAAFLSAIDDKLTHTQNQLAAAKQYKQGLLQQMFVQG